MVEQRTLNPEAESSSLSWPTEKYGGATSEAEKRLVDQGAMQMTPPAPLQNGVVPRCRPDGPGHAVAHSEP